jgi:mannose-6-phosphate isomerase-like protein (cupin superfamily)
VAGDDRLRLLDAGRRAIAARLTRWEGDDRPTERELRARLAGEGLAPYAWGNPPGDVYPAHRHPFVKVLFCVSGSIRFDLPEEGASLELGPGDRLDLPPGTLHSALVGGLGVVCLEAHRNPPRAATVRDASGPPA